MDALSHQQVGIGDTGREDSHPRFTRFRFGRILLNDL
jgi:hypothetical protein